MPSSTNHVTKNHVTKNGMVLVQYWIRQDQAIWLREHSDQLIKQGKLKGSGRTKNLGSIDGLTGREASRRGKGGMSELLRRVIDLGMSKPHLVEKVRKQ